MADEGLEGPDTLVKRPPVLRGLYDQEEEDTEAVDNSMFRQAPEGHLRFTSKTECEAFVRKHCVVGSNPEFPWLQHMFTTLISWEQVQRFIIARMDRYNSLYPVQRVGPPPAKKRERNVYMRQDTGEDIGVPGLDSLAVMDGVRRRLDLPFHKVITRRSTINTLLYLFEHMRCGIFVMIRANRLVIFAPFVNKDYRNDWEGGDKPALDPKYKSLEDYYRAKEASGYRREQVLQDRGQWWANGNIICNEHQRPGEPHSQYWGDQFMSALRDLLQEACETRLVPDCEFFINKRDYPHLKFNPTSQEPVEPYGFIYDRDDRVPAEDVPLRRRNYAEYTPIASFYCSDRFADLPFPTSEDWEAATGMVYPKTFSHTVHKNGDVDFDPPRDLFTQENFQKFECAWEDKVDTAFFRGTATGGGTTPDTNQRLKLALLSHEWKSNPAFNGSVGASSGALFLDAAITGWNKRDKKLGAAPMTFLDTGTLPFSGGKEHFTPIYQQSRYKYLIYAEGHCAACRYGFMMRLGSVIIKVESSCVADLMWYFPLLRPWVDHIPVKADLSDLADKIAWCRAHDDECRKIAAAGQALYERFVGRDAALDYLQALAYEINARYFELPAWSEAAAPASEPPPMPWSDLDCCYYRQQGAHLDQKHCVRCKREKERDRATVEARAAAEVHAKESVKEKQANLRNRMIRKAQAEEAAKKAQAAAGSTPATDGAPAAVAAAETAAAAAAAEAAAPDLTRVNDPSAATAGVPAAEGKKRSARAAAADAAGWPAAAGEAAAKRARAGSGDCDAAAPLWRRWQRDELSENEEDDGDKGGDNKEGWAGRQTHGDGDSDDGER